MSAHRDRPEMSFRVTVHSSNVRSFSQKVKEEMPGQTVRIGPSVYSKDDCTAMVLIFLTEGKYIVDRSPNKVSESKF